MYDEKNFDEKFKELGEYYNINSPDEIRKQLKMNENIFTLLEEVKPYLEESFSDAEYTLEMNFEPEMDDDFIILRVDVTEERFNKGIGDEMRQFDSKTRELWKNANICRELCVMLGILDV